MSIQRKPTFCPFCHSNKIIRKGTRSNQHRIIPLYFCKSCFKYFSLETISRVKFPPRIIMKALTYYNLGYSQDDVSGILINKHRINVPRRTISSWIKKYSNICTFGRLRNEAKKLYLPQNMISSRTFEHRQVYLYKLHNAKLTLLEEHLSRSQDYQHLCTFLQSIIHNDTFPHHLFLHNTDQPEQDASQPLLRSSQLKLELLPVIEKRKENLANDLALLGLEVARRNMERHEQIQEFMLINDSSTIACEVPVYLTAEHIRYFRETGFKLSLTEQDAPITGHIDFVQVRNGFIHILDYKPEARKINPVSQLTIYALALASHTKLPLKLFKCAWFDEKDYFEFYPLHCVYPKYSIRR